LTRAGYSVGTVPISSDATVHPGGAVTDVDFDKLVLEADKLQKAPLIFRLAESTNVILVHEKLRDHLLAKEFVNLKIFDPGEVAT